MRFNGGRDEKSGTQVGPPNRAGGGRRHLDYDDVVAKSTT
jgi:hypothetical protein